MSTSPAPLPEPVRNGTQALRVMFLATGHPLEPETLAFFLDDAGVGGLITVVSGTADADSVIRVVEYMSQAAEGVPHATCLVVASVRPAGGLLPGDDERWRQLDRITAEHGVQLLEWFVIGLDGAHCPRELAGDAGRWSPLARPRP